jgi:hypothetical protein
METQFEPKNPILNISEQNSFDNKLIISKL